MSDFCRKWGNVLTRYENQTVNHLEIGVYKGLSLSLWKSFYGPDSNIYGIERDLSNISVDTKDFKICNADALDETKTQLFLQDILFDVIVDDASPHEHVEVFDIYSNKLTSDGVYIIETFKPRVSCYTILNDLKNKHKDFKFDIILTRMSNNHGIIARRNVSK